jgi:hypothetical protein
MSVTGVLVESVPWLANGGAIALLGWVARQFFTGNIISARAQQTVNTIQEERLKELWKINHDLQDAWRKSQEANAIQAQQISKLLELGRLSEALLRALNYSLQEATEGENGGSQP